MFRLAQKLYDLFRKETARKSVVGIAFVLGVISGFIEIYEFVSKPREISTKLSKQIESLPDLVVPKPSQETSKSEKEAKPKPAAKAGTNLFVLISRPESEGGDFYIGKYEITNQEYEEFVRAAGHSESFFSASPRFNQSNQPVVGVSYFDAVAYCIWLSQKKGGYFSLPTEEEWKLAAYGVGQRQYPWSNASPTRALANYDNLDGGPMPVDIYPNGATPEGVFNMGGNVWEWCDTWYDFNQAERVIRGGAWNSSPDFMQIGIPGSERPEENRRSDIGFRIVLSLR
jgi:serine/threonine-protein kinase